eukprot:536481-Rhodomonas_salina.2
MPAVFGRRASFEKPARARNKYNRTRTWCFKVNLWALDTQARRAILSCGWGGVWGRGRCVPLWLHSCFVYHILPHKSCGPFSDEMRPCAVQRRGRLCHPPPPTQVLAAHTSAGLPSAHSTPREP